MKHFLTNEEGQGFTEYALIAVLVSIVAVAVLTSIGGKVVNMFNKVEPAMNP